MIKSSTQLLVDIKELDYLVASSNAIEAVQKEEQLKAKREFLLHINLTLKYFHCISWHHKLQFLTDFAEHLNSIGTIELLLNTLFIVSGKMTVYCKCEPDIQFTYDKAPNDHDRMLEPHVLKEYWMMEVEWFKTITEDNEQVMVIILLLRSAGGNIVWKFYSILQKLYAQKKHRAEHIKHLTEEQKVKDQQQNQKNSDTPAFLKSQSHTEDSFHVNCEMLLKKWDDSMLRYRIQVEKEENKLLKLFGKKTDKKKGKKGKKGRKGTKKNNKKSKSKTSKSSKSSTKPKKKDDTCDWIQLLPLGTVKRIFNNLDDKTLKKCKKVNDYWNWVITDLLKDRKARKSLDKMIAGLNQSAGDISHSTKIYESEEQPKRKTATERRVKRGLDRGAILKKLCATNEPLVEQCLWQVIVCDRPEDYIAPLHKAKIFPRVDSAQEPLYKFPSLICLDVDKIIAIDPLPGRQSDATCNQSRKASTQTCSSKTGESTSSEESSTVLYEY